MEENLKSAYIASGGILLFGALLTIIAWPNGFNSQNLSIFLGPILAVLGFGGILKPQIIGEILVEIFRRAHENQTATHQTQHKSPGSMQGKAGRDLNQTMVTNVYGKEQNQEALIKSIEGELEDLLGEVRRLKNIAKGGGQTIAYKISSLVPEFLKSGTALYTFYENNKIWEQYKSLKILVNKYIRKEGDSPIEYEELCQFEIQVENFLNNLKIGK